MNTQPSHSVRLFGTDEPVPSPRILMAGPLSAELEAGNLRYVRFAGVELIRAISFILRNADWGTYNPEISNLAVEETRDAFRVAYNAVASDAEQSFRYSAEIEGRSDGQLVFRAEGVAASDFITNRTGFVVLHPLEGVSGHSATVEDVDGKVVETVFPDLIDPVQPMKNLRAITHQAAPGLMVTCRMEGDAFEMEDQRNWTDASYKTYVRPLALPWPYRLPAGSRLKQAVTLSVQGRPPVPVSGRDSGVAVTLGSPIGTVPPLGFGLDPDHAEATMEAASLLRSAHPAHVVCHFDSRRGHGAEALRQMAEVAAALQAEPWLEFVVTQVEAFREELADIAGIVAGLGSPYRTVLVSPASDMKSTTPGGAWPPAPDLSELYRETRRAFPGVRIGGGMFSYFTELNRKRPPLADIDLVTFTTSGLVHAGDDRSATEGLEALPYIARSVAAIAGDRPWNVGPSALGMRMNPYGSVPAENPGNIRQAMNRADPRQRGLLGAAYYLGIFAHMARGGAASLSLGGGVGEFGIVQSRGFGAAPWFDEAGGVFPAFHVFKGLAALKGARLLDCKAFPPRNVQAVAAETAAGREAWIANLTGERIRLPTPTGFESGSLFMLDADSFVQAAGDPGAAERSTAQPGPMLEFAPYAVARLASP